jgi:beta-D-galactosyl-(1->4)-L-rhamnose phosphorylase
MFYDDHWVGTEPYGARYKDFGFDGLIKCVFSGFEVRLCAGAQGVKTKELRLHPYLFPTGLKGEPTFQAGGTPTADCQSFWVNNRRALLRESVDRIGLGGYLHLVQGYPDFIEYMQKLAQEFRTLRQIRRDAKPYTTPFKIAVLTAWGKSRSWICNGHFIHGLELNELIESLAGLPVEVEFISFDDLVENGLAADVRVLVNCGRANTAWCGGEHWKNSQVIECITQWVGQGGGFVGIGEPSAINHQGQYMQLSHLLGVDREMGLGLSMGRYAYTTEAAHFIMEDVAGELDFGNDVDNMFASSHATRVLADRNGSPRIATHNVGQGRSLYLSGFKYTPQNTRLLHRALYWTAGAESDFGAWVCSNLYTECAYYAESHKLIVINNSDRKQVTRVFDSDKNGIEVSLEPHGMKILDV